MNPFTFPGETGHDKTVFNILKRLNPDAIRDSDGTQLSKGTRDLNLDLYATLCLVRADQDFAYDHPEYHVRKFLMSSIKTAFETTLSIYLLKGYSPDKYEIDFENDHYKYWEVINRTTNEVHPITQWEYDGSKGLVIVHKAKQYHEYTVNFLARQTWDSVSMYNSLVNGWTDRKTIGVDPYHEKCRNHLYNYFEKWLEDHDHCQVVRFTTFAYQFVIDSNELNGDMYRDWFGYGECISPQALSDFEKEYGYALRSEDFVDSGFYNSTNRPANQRYIDWMNFIHKFVIEFSSKLVSMAHEKGLKTAMFQGDHWIGTETFSEKYGDIGLDINIGAVEDGVALRRLSDSPGKQIREARFYPYFFPDIFREGGDPLSESINNWIKIRRALLRKPIDRIGYGGRVSLAAKFPDFIDHVEHITNDFSKFLNKTQKAQSWIYPLKVGVLNSWGKWRSWLQNQSIDQKFHIPARPDVMEFVGTNTLECLAGLPFDVQFINFEDINNRETLQGFDVIINSGDQSTSWSGGFHWNNKDIIENLREWVSNGGGFLGISNPTAFYKGSHFFQLADILGVDKEVGNGLGYVASNRERTCQHFIDSDCHDLKYNLEVHNSCVFPISDKIEILQNKGAHILRSAHRYGKGRSIYIAGLPFNPLNSRMLLRSILWLSRKESFLERSFSTNINTDCAIYTETGWGAVVNNIATVVDTEVFDNEGKKQKFSLDPYQWKWFKL